MKKKYSITVKGIKHTWDFNFIGNSDYLKDWHKDGLDIDEVINEIPVWLPWYLIKIWCRIQDIFNFRFLK